MIVLPQKAALPLLPAFGEDAKIKEAFATLQQMVGRGEAKMLGNLVVRGEAGEKLSSKSVEEVRYGTEFDPPQLPAEIPKENAVEALKNWPLFPVWIRRCSTR